MTYLNKCHIGMVHDLHVENVDCFAAKSGKSASFFRCLSMQLLPWKMTQHELYGGYFARGAFAGRSASIKE
jgi:hypothetical protein